MEEELKRESLLNKWKNREQKTSDLKSINKAPLGVKIPLSYGQKRLFFLQQLYPDNPFYNYSETYTFTGTLNKEHLIESLKKVYKDHDILRTTYHIDGENIFQEVDILAEMDISLFDLSGFNKEYAELECHKIMEIDATKHFDLDKSPLVRVALIKLDNTRHILQITLHHIITDKWSMQLFRTHLADYYRQLNNNIEVSERKTKLQYADYAYWLENQKINAEHLNYWKNKLSGDIPILNLPTDYSRPMRPSFKGAASFIQVFNTELSSKLLNLSKKLNTTPYNLMLSVYYVLLYRYSGQTDILIGSPVTNRDKKELEELIGFFNDTIVLRTNLSPSMSFIDLVNTVRKNTLEAFDNKDIPFDILVKELKVDRTLSINPFFQVMFLYHSVPENPFFDDNLSLTHTWFDSKVVKFDLTIYVSEENGLLSSTFEYASDLFEEKTINRFQNYFKLLLEGVVSNPNQNIANIPIINDTEKQFLSNQRNKISNYQGQEKGIHNIIKIISETFPHNIAVSFNETSITYKELNDRADLVANNLLNHLKVHNEVIALYADISLELIIGMLGILKAGCAYLPIDPDYPIERIHFILNDSKANIILTKKILAINYSNFDLTTLFIEDLIIPKNGVTAINHPETRIDDLAYIIYTSGSTGQPKGVPITHKNIINSTAGRLDFYDNNPSAFLLLSSISFDSSKAGIFWTLCTGGNLVITKKGIEQDLNELTNIIKSRSISHTLMLPSLFKLILEYTNKAKLQSLNTVIVAGEACSTSLCEIHFDKIPHTKLYNEYGPTEATVWCMAHQIKRANNSTSSVPIGKPVAGASVYLLDKDLKLVPFGAVGEIYIGGNGLSKGYYNRPDLTENTFINNPFCENEKLYKTGDLGKLGNDGNLEFLGRSDQQIKIRGYRIEIEEIEKVLNKCEVIKNAIVLVEQLNESNKRLIAYLKTESAYNETDIKQYLKKELPNYMVPSSFVVVDEIPLLPNGKVDKKALSKIKNNTQIDSITVPEKSRTDLEKKLIAIWEEVLGFSPIATEDNFFEIGGDSILSIQIISKARKNNIQLSPSELFEHQTIKELAHEISNNKEKKWDYVTTIRKEGNKKPLFCIHSGGGHVFFYGILKNHLATNRPIYAFHPTESNKSYKLHVNIEEMAKDYLKVIREIQPKGPYNILVYCFSASVGNEMAILLESTGEEINVIVLDTMSSAWNVTGNEAFKVRLQFFIKRLFLEPFETVKLFFKERFYLIEPILIKLFGKRHEKELEQLKANLRKISIKYDWKPHSGKVSLILTQKPDKNFQNFMIQSWEKFAFGGVKVMYTSGHHTTLFNDSYIKNLSEKIDECIVD